MKKTISTVILTLVVMLALMPTTALAAVETEIYVDVSENSNVCAGSVHSFPVKILHNTGFTSFSLQYEVYYGGCNVTDKFKSAPGIWANGGTVLGDCTNGTKNFFLITNSPCVTGFTNGGANLTGDGTLFIMNLIPDQDLMDGLYTIKIAFCSGSGDFGYVDPCDSDNYFQVPVSFPTTEFTLTNGISASDVTPAVSIENATYTYNGSEPTVVPLTATVTNAAPLTGLTYQWYKCKAAAGSEYEVISGAVQATYMPILPAVGTYDTYKCVVTNTYNGVAYTGEATATVTYDEAVIDGEQIINIPAPVKNGEPVRVPVVPENANYTGTITWDPVVAEGGRFAANTAYTANVTLSAEANYRFASDVTATVADALASEPTVDTDGRTFTFQAAFGKTAVKEVSSIAVRAKENTVAPTYHFGDELDRSTIQVTATYEDGSVEEIAAGDYTVEYGADGTAAYLAQGDTQVTIRYLNQTVTYPVTVVETRSISDAAVTVTVEPASYPYTGSPIVPTGVEVMDGTTSLTPGKDYTVAFSNHTEAGQADIIVTGIGNYSGTAIGHYEITAKTLGETLTEVVTLQTDPSSKAEIDLTKLLPVDRGSAEPVFTVDAGSLANAVATVGSDGKLVLTYHDAADAPREYETLTVKAAGMRNYTEITIMVTIKYTNKVVVTPVITLNDNLTYNGQPKPATATVAVAETAYTTGLYVKLTYTGTDGTTYGPSEIAPVNVGHYKVTATVTGSAVYTGTATRDFSIVRNNGPIQVAKPTTVPATLTFTESADVTLTCATVDAIIYYTTDGSEPTNGGNEFKADTPIHLTATTTIKAFAVREDMEDSEILTVTFTKQTPSAAPAPSEPTTDDSPTDDPLPTAPTPSAPTPTDPSTDNPSSESSSNSSNTIKNPEGSTTTRVDDKTTGTVTVTTQRPDGSTNVVERQKNGTVTVTDSDTRGNSTRTVTKPDGSSQTTTQRRDGSSSTVYVGIDGRSTTEVKLSTGVTGTGVAVKLPMPEVAAGFDSRIAPVVTVRTTVDRPVKVEIPVADRDSTGRVSSGIVAFLVQADGTEKVIKNSVPTEQGVILTVNSGDQIKIMDNSKAFSDTIGHWGRDAIDFVSSRELFQGTGTTEFSPNSSMTRGMLMTVLARFEDVNTDGGSTWYEKGVDWAVDNGLSDGTDPDAGISREQMVTILYRYAAYKHVVTGTEGDLSAYSDAGEIDSWARDSMSWAVQVGIIGGVEDGILDPTGNVTRTQVAAVIERCALLFAS